MKKNFVISSVAAMQHLTLKVLPLTLQTCSLLQAASL